MGIHNNNDYFRLYNDLRNEDPSVPVILNAMGWIRDIGLRLLVKGTVTIISITVCFEMLVTFLRGLLDGMSA